MELLSSYWGQTEFIYSYPGLTYPKEVLTAGIRLKIDIITGLGSKTVLKLGSYINRQVTQLVALVWRADYPKDSLEEATEKQALLLPKSLLVESNRVQM